MRQSCDAWFAEDDDNASRRRADAAGGALAESEQHGEEAVAHLAWRSRGARLIAVAPHVAAAAPGAVERPCRAPGENLQTAPKGSAGPHFDDHVNVAGLNREVHHPERRWARGRQAGRIADNAGSERSDGNPRAARSATCTGW